MVKEKSTKMSEDELEEEKAPKTRKRKTASAEKINVEEIFKKYSQPEEDEDSDNDSELSSDDEAVEKKVKRGRGASDALTLDKLDKGNIWTVSEEELFNMYKDGRKQDSFSDNESHYMNLIRPVFEFELIDINKEDKVNELRQAGFLVEPIVSNSNLFNAVAIRRRPVKKITDLTLENVHCLTPKQILQLIDDNMGTGWTGLPLAIQDIISQAFYVDSTVMPEMAMHRPGGKGIVDRRIEDGYEVLEIPRGAWIEGVFVKVKPKMEKLHFEALSDKPGKKHDEDGDEDDEEIEDEEEEDDDMDNDEEEEDEEMDDENPEYGEGQDFDGGFDVIDESSEDE